jgi:hypothetical protein
MLHGSTRGTKRKGHAPKAHAPLLKSPPISSLCLSFALSRTHRHARAGAWGSCCCRHEPQARNCAPHLFRVHVQVSGGAGVGWCRRRQRATCGAWHLCLGAWAIVRGLCFAAWAQAARSRQASLMCSASARMRHAARRQEARCAASSAPMQRAASSPRMPLCYPQGSAAAGVPSCCHARQRVCGGVLRE